ncbi:Sugar phosphate isomerase/epimerase [Salegentibacter echinorum]|uniref:Sugar phosphate isomerase/epimerase n=1 Tax=Salegentibacter echinorum TaxID=1073325 RepID=A0A1M5GGY0_SALEC|nr:sugar phosphate isomerase/epimerase family protein [Salegentibacter echinorum]SHG02751.1 Sugar phosphate isomerase/epimerase [Salegentibacter echinorum]
MRRKPVRFLVFLFLSTLSLGVFSCKNQEDKNKNDKNLTAKTEEQAEPFFKISLAQWSLHKPIFAGEIDPMDFAEKANEMGFEGIEYVSGFYAEKIKNAEDPEKAMQKTLDTLKAKSEEFGVENVLIMVDGEGELASTDKETRKQAVENHKKWVDAAQFLGAHTIRVNLFGAKEPEAWKKSAVSGLKMLSEYAKEKNINVLVENHGHFSSNAKLLVEVIKEVNMDNCGTLPDFGNFCIERTKDGCAEEYPTYQGIEEMMPYAKAVSAKSYDFDAKGQETDLDYKRIMQIVKDAGYTGFVGVEYEGQKLSPKEGIMATKKLLQEVGSELNQK